MINQISHWIDQLAQETGDVFYCMEPRSVFDAAIIGVCGGKTVYDRVATIALIQSHFDLSYEDAEEFHYYNQDTSDFCFFLDRPDIPEIDDPTYPATVCDPTLN